MANMAEQLASTLSWENFSKAKDLKKRLWFTLLVLLVFRLGTYIPVPGFDSTLLESLFSQASQNVLGMFNIFSGGALGRMTIFALGIMPYISASIIMQLFSFVFPALGALQKEGESGRARFNQYTRYLTVVIAVLQAYGISIGLAAMAENQHTSLLLSPLLFRFSTVISLTGGTVFLMWLGEQITARGIGNGTSLIIYTGIVASLLPSIASIMDLGRTGALSSFVVVGVLAAMLLLIGLITFMERAQRRVLVQYPKQQRGNKIFGGQSTHMPLKINMSGVIPPIFASSVLLIPATALTFMHGESGGVLAAVAAYLGRGKPVYLLLYASLIVFFAFFYASVIFNPEETAENLRKNGGVVMGVRPGHQTALFFDMILSRLTALAGIYLIIVCILPEIAVSKLAIPLTFGGTSLMIVVSVTMDTVSQIQGHLLSQQYQSLMGSRSFRRSQR